MPTYTYRCFKCGDVDVVQKITDDALTECSVCGAWTKRVYGNVGIAFKGAGFYRTDNPSSS